MISFLYKLALPKSFLLTNKLFIMEIISIIVWALCALVCYNQAEKQGRNKALAAVLGALFGVIAVVIYLVIGPKND